MLADEYRQLVHLLYDLSPGSLIMGFAEANPRQLVSIVGKTQVGITILEGPSPFIFNSTTPIEAELGPLEDIKIFAKFPTSRPDRRTRRSQDFKSYQEYVQRQKNRKTIKR